MASTYLGTSHPHHCSPANEHKDLSAESQESIRVGVFVLGSQCSSCLPASPDDEDVLEVDADDGDEVGRSVGG